VGEVGGDKVNISTGSIRAEAENAKRKIKEALSLFQDNTGCVLEVTVNNCKVFVGREYVDTEIDVDCFVRMEA
jgi:hypothetical protein